MPAWLAAGPAKKPESLAVQLFPEQALSVRAPPLAVNDALPARKLLSVLRDIDGAAMPPLVLRV